MPQAAFYPALAALVLLIWLLLPLPWGIYIVGAVVLTAVICWMLSFFRDPRRAVIKDARAFVSPADGTISSVEYLEDRNSIGGKAVKISIFLSVFNVHINRAPCAGKVESVTYKKGKFINAMNPLAGKVNEANEIVMSRADEPAGKVKVRQVSGAIARHIVCELKPGQSVEQGEQFGMIKFGSCTELLFADNGRVKVLVERGDKVRAGTSVLARYD